ncbi:MAG: hypothetical protein QOI35_1735 [Cryptosporangiaceae bacterium]|nr:hypothetical protein [Cryptosporangiaceae bacterium]
MFSQRSELSERLGPPWFGLGWRLPRVSGLLRWSFVAVLLCVAALLLLSGPEPRSPGVPRASVVVRPSAIPTAAVVVPAGLVGFPLRLPDGGVVSIVRPGQRVDVLGRPGVLAEDVLVLRAAADSDGGLLYLGVSRTQATRLAALVPGAAVTVTVRQP